MHPDDRQPSPLVAVGTGDAQLQDQARRIAHQLGLTVDEGGSNPPAVWLELQADSAPPGYRLCLRAAGADAPGPICAEFARGRLAHRSREQGVRSQPLARAAGLGKGPLPRVLDATAGLGRDAFVLASLGCEVWLVERSAVMAAMLDNALERARHDAEAGPVVARMHLLRGEACGLLQAARVPAPDVVYVDPMYPHRTKSALVKKEMRITRLLVGADEDAPGLLECALGHARRRVVVKRPRGAPALAGHAPSTQISGKSTRFDVYVVAARQSAQTTNPKEG